MTLPRATWGLRVLQASLDETICHDHVVTSKGSSLGNSSAESTPKQVSAVHGDAIGILGKCVCSVALGARPHRKRLHPEGAESTMDCPSPHVCHGYAGILDTCNGRDCLGVLPGTVEGMPCPAEPLVQALSSTAAKFFHS